MGRRPPLLVLVAALLTTACSGTGGIPPGGSRGVTTATTVTTSSTTPTTTTTTTVPLPADVEVLARGVLMVGLPGHTLDDATAATLDAGTIGVILMGRNISDVQQVRALTSAAACAAGGPILVSVDQELSPVVDRLHGLVTPLPSSEEAREMPVADLQAVGRTLGEEMLAMGINVDLAPVIDVVRGSNPVLANRNLGNDPYLVAEKGVAFIEGLQAAGVVAVPKHFPGHGLSATDPHSGVTRIDASLDELRIVDWVPFEAAFAAGVQAVMIGHPIYDAIDPDLPASISPAVLALLRDRFGFDGVAITDSLTMQGVAEGRTAAELAVQSLAAGEDLLLALDPATVGEMVDAIVGAVNSGDLPLARLQEAYSRVALLAESAGTVTCEG
jgi:beta-N-acetylhexosaminidase